MSKTLENLMAAFAGESQANRKYLAYAQAADKAETFFRGEEGPVVDADAHPVEDEK